MNRPKEGSQPEAARRAGLARQTDHCLEAVLRYTANFKQVLMCQSKALDEAQTSYATKLSLRLIEEHLALIKEYRQRFAQLTNGAATHLDAILKKARPQHHPNPFHNENNCMSL